MSSDTNIWETGVNDNGNGTDNNQYFISDTSDAEKRLTIQRGTGNIGVGTNEPSQLLDVSGNINLSGNIYLSNTGTIYKNGQEYAGGSEGTSTVWQENGTKIHYNAGNVGINTSDPTETLEVVGNIKATSLEGDGSGITNLDATELTGIIDNARLPADISATNISGDGSGITNLDATELTGIIDNARLPANISATNISGDGAGITNLDATELTGTIDNARLPANISITGDLTAKNLNVTGVTTTINTDTYQTENLEIISTGADGPSLKITHDTVSHDVMQVIDASGTQSLTMTHEGKIGIGTDSPSAPLHIYDTSDVLKVSNSEITINRNILPETNDSVDIGSAERKIRDMYISDNSLWIGDDHKLAVSGDGTMKFRKRRKSTLPKVLRDASGNDQAALDHINSLHGTSYQNVTELKLNHVLSYARTINPEYKTSDIFGDDAEDYDQDTAADAWQINNSKIYLGTGYTNIGIGTNDPDPNFKLHVNGNVHTDGTISAEDITIKGSAETGSGAIKLNCEANTHGVSIKGPPHSANQSYTLTLPSTAPEASKVLSTDASGNLSWVDPGSSSASSIQNITTTASKVTIDTEMDVTNNVTIKGSGVTGSGAIKLNCEMNSHGVTIKGPPHSESQSYTLTLPSTAPEASKVLSTDESGNLSWIDQASGGGGTGTSGPIELSVENIINPTTSPSLLSNEISSESEYKTIYFNYDSDNVNASGQTEYTLEFNNSTECDILLVGGGGGGGVDNSGGGGAGGLVFLENIQLYNGITIKVGGGGAGAPTSQATAGSNGKDSAIEFVETYIANGGGGGGTGNTSNGVHSGGNGGSGGGSAKENYTGTPGTTDQDQYILNGLRRGWGFAGGNGVDSGGGGGGGASEIGIDGDVAGNKLGGRGGDGKYVVNGTDFKTFFNITNTTIGDHVDGKVYFAGGGGGGNENNLNSTNLPDGSGYSNRGGFGGGGAGGYDTNNKSNSGIANTGGGGGGCTHFGLVDGGAGGSGIVILRYKYRKSLIIPSNYYITKPGPQITSGPVAQIETDIVSNNDLYSYMMFKYDSTNDNGNGQTEYALNFSEDTTIDLLVVAGGGGGGTGSSSSSSVAGAGGGAGGLIYKYNLSIDSRNYTIKIGRGGGGSVITSTTGGENGINSSIEKSDGSGIEGTDNFIAIGGGGGGKRTTDQTGKDGGSGGGAVGGAGIGNSLQSTSLSGGFGNQGGTSTDSAPGGGGGAGAPGSNGVRDNSTQKGHGGDGKQYNITGTYVYYAGGGGSGKGGTSTNHKNDHGIGGLGGGGNGWDNITYITSDDLKGTPHTGGGGGGGSQTTDNVNGGNGGSGVVIIRYLAKTLTQDIDTTLATKAGENIEWDTDNNKFTLTSNVAITSNLDVYNDINFMGNLYQNGELFVSGSGSGGEVTSVTSNILVHKIIEPTTTPSINSVYGTPNDTEYKMMAFQYDSANDNGSEQSIYNITFDNDTICDIFIVGGGGGGGGGSVNTTNDGVGGGGGAGGLVFLPGITLSSTYTIKVGNGGLGQTDAGLNGADSSIERIDGTGTDGIENYIAVGGGGGGDGITTTQYSGPGNSGGSGGGGGGNTETSGGTSTQNTYSGRGFGNAGGNSSTSSGDQAGGGGGAGGIGQTSQAYATADHGGEGGIGIHKVTIDGTEYIFKDLFGISYGEYIESGTTTRDVGTAQDYFNLYYKSGTSTAESPIPSVEEGVYFAGGGAGKTGNSTNTNYLTYGGLGGGASANCVTGVFGSGINGTGGGGTSGGKNEQNEGVGQDSGTNGGSGIVIIRYKIKKVFDDVTKLFQPQFYTPIAEPSVANYGNVTTNLIAHYKFDSSGNLGSNSASTGYILDGTTYGNASINTTKGVFNNSSYYPGNAESRIKIDDDSNKLYPHLNQSAITISFWCWSLGAGGNSHGRLFYGHVNGSANNVNSFQCTHWGGGEDGQSDAAQLTFVISNNGESQTNNFMYTTKMPAFNTAWSHVALVLEPQSVNWTTKEHTVKIYVNGVLDQTFTNMYMPTFGNGTTDTYDFNIGSWINLDSNYREYNGYIDDFRIYNKSLSATEIEQLYTASYIDNQIVSNSDSYKYYSFKNKNKDIVYDFTPYNNLTDWQNYANSIGSTNVTNYIDTFDTNREGGAFIAGSDVGHFTLNAIPSGFNYITIKYGNPENNNPVKILIDSGSGFVEVDSVGSNEYKIYTTKVSTGDILKIEEHNASVIGEDLIIILHSYSEYVFSFPENNTCKLLLADDVNYNDLNNVEETLNGNYIVKVGTIESSIEQSATNFINKSISGTSYKLVYDFSLHTNLAALQNYASTIPNATLYADNYGSNGFYMGSANVGYFSMTMPSGYDNIKVEYSCTNVQGTVNVYIGPADNLIKVSSVGASSSNGTYNKNTYEGTYTAGETVKITEEGTSIIGNDLKITFTKNNYNSITGISTNYNTNNVIVKYKTKTLSQDIDTTLANKAGENIEWDTNNNKFTLSSNVAITSNLDVYNDINFMGNLYQNGELFVSGGGEVTSVTSNILVHKIIEPANVPNVSSESIANTTDYRLFAFQYDASNDNGYEQTEYTLNIQDSTILDILIIGAGGSGGSGTGTGTGAGGGGGGEVKLIESFQATSNTSYTIIVGKGGSGKLNQTYQNGTGNIGNNSSFDIHTALGGGGGGIRNMPASSSSTYTGGGEGGYGGGGNTGASGYDGGKNNNGNGPSTNNGAGGGGGSGGVGQDGSGENGGDGGIGLDRIGDFIFAEKFGTTYGYLEGGTTWFGGGGGGAGSEDNGTNGDGKHGGTNANNTNGISENALWGGGSGGAIGDADTDIDGDGSNDITSGNGGSGIVIIRYKIKKVFDDVTKLFQPQFYTSIAEPSVANYGDVTTNLIAHYKFDNNLNNSIDNNIGTLVSTNTSAQFVDTSGNFVFGKSALVNNTTLTIPNFHFSDLIAGTSKSFTISFWFKANDIAGTWNILFDVSKYVTGNNGGIRVYIKSDEKQLIIVSYDGSSSDSIYISSLNGDFVDDKWRLLTFVFTYNSNTGDIYSYDIKFYEDSVLNGIVNTKNIKSVGTDGFQIGDGNPDATYYNEGYYDDFRIYDRTLLTNEIEKIYKYAFIDNKDVKNSDNTRYYSLKYDQVNNNGNNQTEYTLSFAEYSECEILLLDNNNYNYINYSDHNFYGNYTIKVGISESSIEQSTTNYVKTSINGNSYTLVYDFSSFNDLASIQNYISTIPNATTNVDIYSNSYFGFYISGTTNGYFSMIMPDDYDNIKVEYSNSYAGGTVDLHIGPADNLVNVSSVGASSSSGTFNKNTYEGTYIPGQTLKIDESSAVIGNDLKITFIKNNYNSITGISTNYNTNNVIVKYKTKTLTQDIDTTLANKAGENIEWDTDNNKFTLSSNVAITSNLDVYNDINFMGNLYQNGELFVSGNSDEPIKLTVENIIAPTSSPAVLSYDISDDSDYKTIYLKYDSGNVNASGQTEYTLNFSNSTECDILLIGGGGGGGSDNSGGGGAGGLVLLENIQLYNNVTIKVGGGGAGAASGQSNTGQLGKDSSIEFSETYIAKGGGGGGTGQSSGVHSGTSGGSGGGSAYEGHDGSPGTSTQDQYLFNGLRRGWGFAGGDGKSSVGSSQGAGGGGGGASEVGIDGNIAGNQLGGHGGDGKYEVNGSDFKTIFNITDTTIGDHIDDKVYFAGGGGGGNDNDTNSTNLSDGSGYNNRGGFGGGGNGGHNSSNRSFPGIANTGGGGGGATFFSTNYKGGDGGSGIVILRYKYRKSLNIPSHYYVEKPGPQITSGPVAQVTNSYVTGSELYKYIMFTYDVANDNGSNQTEYALNFSEDTNADILIVAGGGAGGSSHSANGPGGGGGGGVIYLTNVKMQYNVYTIKVGKGGTGVTNGQGQNGFTSSISNGTITIESEGGGAGASSGVNANNGASGGGGDSGSGNTFGTGITKDITLFDNTLVSDYKLGNDGGNYYNLSSGSGGGGGGADSVGQTPTSNNGGDGGDGKNILITGSNTYYGGGGGGGGYTTTSGGSGGLGGGGFAQNNSNGSKNGIDGLGGGGGATKNTQSGGNGGSGVVIIRYLAKSLGQNIDNTLKNKAGENIEWDNTAKKYNLASDVTIANNLIVTGNIIQQYGMGTTESYLFLQTSAVFQNDDIDLYENRKTLITQLAWSPDGQWQSFGGTNKIAEQLQNCFTYFLKGNRRDGNIHIITLNNSQTNATADRKYYAMRISSTQMKVWGSYDTTYPLAYSSALTWVFSSGATIYKTF